MLDFIADLWRTATRPAPRTGLTARIPQPEVGAAEPGYLPGLVTELQREHRLLEASFAALAQAHRSGDGSACFDCLRIFTNALRAHLLKENLWLYRYLEHALRDDRMALARMRALRAEMQAIGRELNAFAAEYAGATWDEARRERLGIDLRRIGCMLDHRIAIEENRLYPLYRAPGCR